MEAVRLGALHINIKHDHDNDTRRFAFPSRIHHDVLDIFDFTDGRSTVC